MNLEYLAANPEESLRKLYRWEPKLQRAVRAPNVHARQNPQRLADTYDVPHARDTLAVTDAGIPLEQDLDLTLAAMISKLEQQPGHRMPLDDLTEWGAGIVQRWQDMGVITIQEAEFGVAVVKLNIKAVTWKNTIFSQR